jgi:hypothetical protein
MKAPALALLAARTNASAPTRAFLGCLFDGVQTGAVLFFSLFD